MAGYNDSIVQNQYRASRAQVGNVALERLGNPAPPPAIVTYTHCNTKPLLFSILYSITCLEHLHFIDQTKFPFYRVNNVKVLESKYILETVIFNTCFGNEAGWGIFTKLAALLGGGRRGIRLGLMCLYLRFIAWQL